MRNGQRLYRESGLKRPYAELGMEHEEKHKPAFSGGGRGEKRKQKKDSLRKRRWARILGKLKSSSSLIFFFPPYLQSGSPNLPVFLQIVPADHFSIPPIETCPRCYRCAPTRAPSMRMRRSPSTCSVCSPATDMPRLCGRETRPTGTPQTSSSTSAASTTA